MNRTRNDRAEAARGWHGRGCRAGGTRQRAAGCTRPAGRSRATQPSASARRRRTAGALLARAAWLVPLLFLGTAGTAEAPTTKPGPPLAERVMAELRAANAARAQLLREEQAWALDKEKLALLQATVRHEARRLTAAAAQARRQASDLRKQTADLQALRQKLRLVEAMIDTLSERLENALDALGGRSLPGLVPPDTAAGITEPPRRLAAAAGRLQNVEQRLKKPHVELVVGTLAGRSTTVKLLCVGGSAAWWTTLDGSEAGQAARKDGTLVLSAARTPAEAAAIRKAFAIVEGRAAPDWVLLPVHQAEPK